MQGSYRKLEDLISDQLSAFADYFGIVVVQPEHKTANAYFSAGTIDVSDPKDLNHLKWIMVRKNGEFWQFNSLSENEKNNFISLIR